jgi:hypothetical protein
MVGKSGLLKIVGLIIFYCLFSSVVIADSDYGYRMTVGNHSIYTTIFLHSKVNDLPNQVTLYPGRGWEELDESTMFSNLDPESDEGDSEQVQEWLVGLVGPDRLFENGFFGWTVHYNYNEIKDLKFGIEPGWNTKLTQPNTRNYLNLKALEVTPTLFFSPFRTRNFNFKMGFGMGLGYCSIDGMVDVGQIDDGQGNLVPNETAIDISGLLISQVFYVSLEFQRYFRIKINRFASVPAPILFNSSPEYMVDRDKYSLNAGDNWSTNLISYDDIALDLVIPF